MTCGVERVRPERKGRRKAAAPPSVNLGNGDQVGASDQLGAAGFFAAERLWQNESRGRGSGAGGRWRQWMLAKGRDDGVITGSAALEDGFVFKRPDPSGGFEGCPAEMFAEDSEGVVVVRSEVGAEIEPSPLPCPRRHVAQEVGLHDAVLVVTELRPRVGKEHKYTGQAHCGGQQLKEESGLGVDEVEIGQFGAITFLGRTTDALAHDVDTDAELVGMCLGVGREKMAVAAANFPHQRHPGTGLEDESEAFAKFSAASLHQGEELGSAGGIFHKVSG